jgi:Holliday junction resolvase
MTLREFPVVEADRMIDDLFQSSGYALPQSRKEALIQLTNGHPFYLQILGEEICKNSLRKKVPAAAFKESIQNTLFNSTGRLFLYFQDLFAKCTRNSTSAERILVAIANGNQSNAEIAGALHQSTGEAGSLILRLLSLDVIVKENKRYFFRDPVFARWVQGARSFWKTKMTPVLVGTAAEKAVAEKLSAEGFSAIYQSKASRGAFDLLAIFNSYKVGLQIKVAASFPFYVRAEEIAKMIFWGQKLKWTPMLCLYQKAAQQVCYFLLDNLKKTGKSYRVDGMSEGSDRLLPIFLAVKSKKRTRKSSGVKNF